MTEKEFNQLAAIEAFDCVQSLEEKVSVLESKAVEADMKINALQQENNQLKTGFYNSPFVDETVASNDRLKIQLGERDILIKELQNTNGKLFEVKMQLEVGLAAEKASLAASLEIANRLRERIDEFEEDLKARDYLAELQGRVNQDLIKEKEDLQVKIVSLTSGNEWFTAELQRVNEQSLEFLKDRKTLRAMVGILMKEIEQNEQQLR